MKLIYIMGYGRSGSTLLESFLSRELNTSAYGEIKYIYERSILSNEPCSCGETIGNCPAWKYFKKSKEDAESLSALTKRFESTILLPLNLILKSKKKLLHYQQGHDSVVNYIETNDTSEGIIDSSKMPSRFFWLFKKRRKNIYLIHLTRDPRGVAWSNQKNMLRFTQKEHPTTAMPKFSYYSSYGRWLANLLASEYTKTNIPKEQVLNIQYEDFVKNPQNIIEKISKMTGIPRRTEADTLIYHSISGNPARFSDNFNKIKPDEEWKQKLPKSAMVIGGVLCKLRRKTS